MWRILIKTMSKEETIKVEGKVEELLPNMTFKVILENGMSVIAHLCGKMRMRNIRVYAGDSVTIEMSPYDLSKARIIYRHK
jgi:translation initiation factor IF-1